MLKNYNMVFKLFVEDGNVIASDLETYTPRNFKRLL